MGKVAEGIWLWEVMGREVVGYGKGGLGGLKKR